MAPNELDLLLRVIDEVKGQIATLDRKVDALATNNTTDHGRIETAIQKQDCTDRVSGLEGQLHGSWAVFGGLLALLGFIVGLFAFLRGR